MGIPTLSPEQREAALVKATSVRMARRAFKERVTNGDIPLELAIQRAKADDALAGIRVLDIVKCVPGIGPRRAEAVMEQLDIARSRRIRGLGIRQVDALVRRLGS